MIDAVIVLIGCGCIANITYLHAQLLGRPAHVAADTLWPEMMLRRRQFTRAMHFNLGSAGAVILVLLLAQPHFGTGVQWVEAEPGTVTSAQLDHQLSSGY